MCKKHLYMYEILNYCILIKSEENEKFFMMEKGNKFFHDKGWKVNQKHSYRGGGKNSLASLIAVHAVHGKALKIT